MNSFQRKVKAKVNFFLLLIFPGFLNALRGGTSTLSSLPLSGLQTEWVAAKKRSGAVMCLKSPELGRTQEQDLSHHSDLAGSSQRIH